nr:retrovirus-related Pol polyprotein from transposon TNT 1-94 [Tanacetum cinerariifolium]
MFVVDTLRIIKEYNFRGKIQKDLLELGMQEPKRPQNLDYFKDKMLLMQTQENGEILDEEQLLFLAGEQVTNFDDDVDDPTEQDLALSVDHVFEANQCDAFDSDVDEAPMTQTMFMHHDEHEMQNNVQQDYVADSDVDYTSDSNIIPYDQYVEDNTKQVVQKLHSVKMQLRSTIDHNKSMKEEVTTLKRDLKKDKFIEEFIDIKALKEKVEDRLFKQDQSVQTVHMLCKPKPFYDEKKK